MFSFEDVRVEVNGTRATVTINRPDRSNAVRTQTVEELTEAFDRLGDHPDVRVIVLTGAGDRAFCAGADIGVLADATATDGRRMARKQAQLCYVMRNIDQPILARINGACLGFGNELQLFCDLALAADTAKLGQVGPTVGACPVIGATQFLPRLMGDRRAREVIYLCERYAGEEAEKLGLVNRAVPAAELDALVDRWCERISSMSPQSIRIAKLSLNFAADELTPSLHHGVELTHAMWGSADWVEGVAAVKERRAPRFGQK